MNFQYGHKVSLKKSKPIICGRVLRSYGNYCDVVWECDEEDWWRFSAQRELKINLVHGWITQSDISDTLYGDNRNEKLI